MLKLTLMEGESVVGNWRLLGDFEDELFAVIEESAPDCGAFCCVGRFDPRLVESLRLALGGRLLILSRSTPLPIGIEYATPHTLGPDRIALAAGAASLYPGESIAVVDAGTAVTLDVVNAEPVFTGGRITAGLRLRFESLHSHTSALPLVGDEGMIPVAGDSTDSCIRSGVVMGLADEIIETFRQYNETFGCSRCVLTGGDAALLTECISNRIPVDHKPDLMAYGLHYIFKHNENFT